MTAKYYFVVIFAISTLAGCEYLSSNTSPYGTCNEKEYRGIYEKMFQCIIVNTGTPHYIWDYCNYTSEALDCLFEFINSKCWQSAHQEEFVKVTNLVTKLWSEYCNVTNTTAIDALKAGEMCYIYAQYEIFGGETCKKYMSSFTYKMAAYFPQSLCEMTKCVNITEDTKSCGEDFYNVTQEIIGHMRTELECDSRPRALHNFYVKEL